LLAQILYYTKKKGANMTATMNISEKLYNQANETARLMGLSNMQFFEIAIRQYIREQKAQNINKVFSLREKKEDDTLPPLVKSMLGAFKTADTENMSLYYKDEINAAKEERFRKKGLID